MAHCEMSTRLQKNQYTENKGSGNNVLQENEKSISTFIITARGSVCFVDVIIEWREVRFGGDRP